MRWLNNKSFVVKMVNNEDVDETETVSIDVEETLNQVLKASLILMGAYMGMSTVRQLIVGHPEASKILTTVAPVFNNNNSSNVVNFAGHARKIVIRLEDEKMWPSVTSAAKEAGVSVPKMSGHLNNHDGFPHINNMHYAISGLGTTG